MITRKQAVRLIELYEKLDNFKKAYAEVGHPNSTAVKNATDELFHSSAIIGAAGLNEAIRFAVRLQLDKARASVVAEIIGLGGENPDTP